MTTITTDVVTVQIQGITGDLEAKIDTGAHQTSMHADEIDVKDDDTVVFKLNGRVYRAPLETTQDISSSDGGTQSRPVIKSTIEIAGKSVDTLINLNDRSDMPQKVLIGQDVIRSAELTLQFTEEPTNGDQSQDQLAGQTPSIYSPVSDQEPEARSAAGIDVDLNRKILKLISDLNQVQRDLMDVVAYIQNRKGSNE